MKWLPFDTAPKDGTYILAWVGYQWDGRMPFVRTRWHLEGWRSDYGTGFMPKNFAPTHWAPMPTEPIKD